MSAEAEFVRGRGLRLYRSDGVEFLDAVSGTFNLPLGYDHPTVRAAIHAQIDEVSHLSSEHAAVHGRRLLTRLLAGAPPGIDAGWLRDLGGSTANECAMKIAQKVTGATDIVSLFLSHHGQTLATISTSGNAFRRRGVPMATTPYALRVPAPHCHRCFYAQDRNSCALLCAERIEDFIQHASNGTPAAVIVEPVLGNGGNIVPPPGYFAVLRRLCDRHGMLLIVDEVQTGLGRTGTLFACEALGIEPDIITLAKGLGGVGLPIGAVLFRSKYDVLEPHEHSFTSGANLLAIRAAEATLDVITSPDFLARVRAAGDYLERLLRGIGARFACIGEVRGLGLMWGLELDAPDGSPAVELTRRVVAAAREQRLLIRSSQYGRGNVVKVRPSLTATDADLEEIAKRLADGIQQAIDA